MSPALADFPDRAPPSTSTRRPTRAVARDGAALSKLIGAAGGRPGSSSTLVGRPGGGPESFMLIGWAGGGPRSSVLMGGAGDGAPRDGGESGEGGAAGCKRPVAASSATSPITTTAGLVTSAARTAPARSRSGAVTTRCRRLQPSDTTAPG